MSRRRPSEQHEAFDPLVAARRVLRDPHRFNGGKLDGRELSDVEYGALVAELQTMAELAEEALLPGDPDRDAILTAYYFVQSPTVVIPAGR